MQWIDIKEEEPERHQKILAFGDVYDEVHHLGVDVFVGHYQANREAYSDLGECDNITHWMPEPKAP